MEAHFTHEALDTKAQRTTPYVSLQRVSLNGEWDKGAGDSMASARFRSPGGDDMMARVEAVDLGPVRDDLDMDLVARALLVTLGVMVLSRR